MKNAVCRLIALSCISKKTLSLKAVALAAMLLKLLCASVGGFCLVTLLHLRQMLDEPFPNVRCVLYYALFSVAVTICFCFYQLVVYCLRRYYLLTVMGKNVSLFVLMKISFQLKIIYIHLYGIVMRLLTFTFYLAPSAVVLVVTFFCLRGNGIYAVLFIMLALLFAILFTGGLCFAQVAVQRYACLDEALILNPEFSVRGAIAKSRLAAKGSSFDFWKLKLWFTGWFAMCVLLLPLFFVLPYYRGSFAAKAQAVLLNR